MEKQEFTEPHSKEAENQEKLLADFKVEMRTLKRQEEQAFRLKEENPELNINSTWHFGDINPDELTAEDRDMWEIVKGHQSGREELLGSLIKDYRARVADSENVSRKGFAAFLSNRATVIIAKKELEDLENSE